MNKHFKNYLTSFKLKKEYWHTLLIDAAFLGAIVSVFIFFGNLLKEKAYMISQGKTTEQLQQMLLSMDPELAQAFLSNIKVFVITFALGLIVVLAGGLLFYSLSRKLIWDCLLEKKFDKKTYWKWNLLNLVLIIPAAVYLFAFGLARLILGYGVSLFKSQMVLDEFYNLANLFLLFIFIIFIFLVYYNFVKEYKVWESIGKAFHLIKIKWKRIWPMFLLIMGTAVVLSLVLWPVGRLFAYQAPVLVGINIAVSLLFLAWIRIYVFGTIKE